MQSTWVAPRSFYVSQALSRYNFFTLGLLIIVIILVGFLITIGIGALVVGVPRADGTMHLAFKGRSVWILVIGAAAVLWFSTKQVMQWRRKRCLWLKFNEFDYRRSVALQDVFAKFNNIRSSEVALIESAMPGSWRPYSIEPYVGSSTHGTFSGLVDLTVSPMAFLFGGSITGTMNGGTKGRVSPNLLDRSTSILFKDDQDNTLRVHVPSPKAVKEILVSMIEQWSGDIPEGSHTHEALQGFALRDDYLVGPVSNQQLIDRLEVSLRHPFEERPQVTVVGKEIEPGVVFATALEVGGERKLFFPSGFFDALHGEGSQALGLTKHAPALTEAIERP